MGRLQHIDTLRGIAVVAVVLQHLLENTGFVPVISFGRFGVLLFFLISGYVIPFSFSGDRPLRRFAVTRIFRLYPAYWLSLSMAAMLGAGTSSTILLNLTMLQRAFATPDVVGVYWSLFYELCFYALCCLLFAAGALKKSGILALLAAISLALHIELCLADHLPPIWSEGFEFIGFMLAGSVFRRAYLEHDPAAMRWATPLVALLVTTGVVGAGVINTQAMNFNAFMSARAMGLAAVLAVLVFQFADRIRLDWPAMRYVGKISYSVYLIHAVVLIALGSLNLSPVYFAICLVTATSALSVMSYNLVEVPANSLGRWLMKAQPIASEPIAI